MNAYENSNKNRLNNRKPRYRTNHPRYRPHLPPIPHSQMRGSSKAHLFPNHRPMRLLQPIGKQHHTAPQMRGSPNTHITPHLQQIGKQNHTEPRMTLHLPA